jgi:thiosulfate reductase cytochrome b subunit
MLERLHSVQIGENMKMPMLRRVTSTSFMDETGAGHARWVRVSHWIVAVSVLTLGVSGFTILMSHPRLYWGEVGNGLTPALELPLGRNHWHITWGARVPFFPSEGERSPITAVRTYDILNENSWGRSLHFLAAWFLVFSASFYALASLLTGHFRRDLLPRLCDLEPRALLRSLSRGTHRAVRPGPPYNALQKCTYVGVVFIGLPVMALTGMTMSPAITASYPFLLDVFGGSQSARTLHFGMFCLLTLFLGGHVLLSILSGFKRQIRAITFGAQS